MSKTHERAIALLSEKIRLGKNHRWLLDSVFTVVALSGVVWLLIHYGVADEEARWPVAWQSGAMKIHGLAALLSLLAIGSLWPNHIRRAWYLRRNIGIGIALIVAATVLIVTGYLLYYFVSEATHELVSILHWGIGLLAVVLLPWHVWTGKRNHRKSGS